MSVGASGKRRRQGGKPPTIEEFNEVALSAAKRACLRRAKPRRARRIREVYEVNPLHCPRCGGAMRVIAVIEQPDVSRQTLEPLGLAVPVGAERSPPQLTRRLAVAEAPEWTSDPMDADRPLGDPLTV